MDWIGSRISQRCERWMDMLETDTKEGGKMWRTRTPWWEEVKRCVDGDHVPSSVEGWNHPVSRAYGRSPTLFLLELTVPLVSCHSNPGRVHNSCKSIASFARPHLACIRLSALGRYHLLTLFLDHPSCEFTTRRANVGEFQHYSFVSHLVWTVVYYPLERRHCSTRSRSNMASIASCSPYSYRRRPLLHPFLCRPFHHDFRPSPSMTRHPSHPHPRPP